VGLSIAVLDVASSALSLVLGYLFGSIPFGLILTQIAGTTDLRAIGSGNIGATNVLRTGRKDLAALTLALDLLKGTVAVLLGGALAAPEAGPFSPALFAAFGAFIGHVFPVWLNFRGGKGVATFLGCLLAIAWPVALIFGLVWLAVAYTTRYSSAGALSASLAVPVALFFLGQPDAAILFSILAVILWAKHSANIARLLAGTESRIGQKS
jgi:glycerol-3-phosphate acyltransferase PlsY